MRFTSRWLYVASPRPYAEVRLFCFGYAGAGASLFREWPGLFPQTVEVCPVQLPGRESRLDETPFDRLKPLAAASLDGLFPHMNKPFAIFGSSMGAALGFELICQLRERDGPKPLHLFVAACGAPHIPEPAPLHGLSDVEMLAELREYGALPREVLDRPELAQVFLPAIRADCAACESYVRPAETPLTVPISVYGGLDDPTISRDRLESWRDHTHRFRMRMFPGGHLFVNTATSPLIEDIARQLRQSLDAS